MKAFVAGALLMAAPGAAFAQDQYEQQVRTQINAVYDTLDDDGWALSSEIYIDSLEQDANDSVELALIGNTSYAIVAVCDTDCSDVDLYLYDKSENLLVEDTAVDDYPVLEFVAPASDQYRLRVRMYQCAAEPCRYGVAVFSH